jgi:hypothetical protein
MRQEILQRPPACRAWLCPLQGGDLPQQVIPFSSFFFQDGNKLQFIHTLILPAWLGFVLSEIVSYTQSSQLTGT